MSERLNIVITSGGTEVPIDDVRVISNVSSGTTGALITEEALQRGHNVHLLRSKAAKVPFDDKLRADPLADDIQKESQRIESALREISPLVVNLTDEPIRNFGQYRQRLLEAVADPNVDVAIISMAASDFGPEKAEGKISSDNQDLVIRLQHLPKIISEVKPTRREIFLVGFKFLDEGAAPDELIESAYKSLLRDKQDLAVANLGRMGTPELLTYLVTLEKGVIPIGDRAELPRILLETIEQRYSKRHYQTKLTRVERLPVSENELNQFLGEIHSISRLALFDEYLEGGREEFGFLAKRTKKGTLITGRGSSKSRAQAGDLALVTGIDEEARTMSVESLGIKASLNANIAHLILSERPDINYVVHSHIELPDADCVELQSSPGTQEDWDRMKDLVKSGKQVVYQPGHGVVILLKSLDELRPLLLKQNIYAKRPDFYDSAYARFHKNTRFIEIVRERLNPDGIFLDLAAGTGEVTRQLLDIGFNNIHVADASENMLGVAKQKLPELDSSRFQVQTFECIDDAGAYDGVFIRQAVNYIPPERLVEVFARFKRALKDGGMLSFKSLKTECLESNLRPVKRDEAGTTITLTQEGNIVDGNVIYHGQRTEAFNRESRDYNVIYDLNKFFIYEVDTFEQALRKSGFVNIDVIDDGKSVYFCAS